MNKKAVMIIHNSAIDEEVNVILEELGVNCYTKLPNALGRGELSAPHFNTPVWPGVNCATLIFVEESKAVEVFERVKDMRKSLGKEGIKAVMWQIEDITECCE